MNIVELLIFVLLTVVIGFVAHFLSGAWGPIAWLVLLPIGYLWLRLIVGTIKSFFSEMRESARSRPVCRQGKCQSKDYVLVDPRPSSTVFRCRCGDLYLRQGNYFSHMMPGMGSVEPYMVQDRSGEWKPDSGVLINQGGN